MKLSELVIGSDILDTNITDFDVDIKAVTDRSWEINEGDLFIALKGHRCDGHGYIGEALKRRAAVIVIEDSDYIGDFPYIRVPTTRRAYAGMWCRLCPFTDMKLIAVTGTNGKSSIVSVITHILNYNGIRAASIGTLNSSLTTPDPPELYPRLKELCEAGTEYVVMEASSHALALEKLAPLRFEYGVFTNLTRDHLDFHGDMESYLKAKSRLFELCDNAIYNYDDRWGSYCVSECRGRIYSYSTESDNADFTAKNVFLELGRSRFDMLSEGELFRIELPLTGEFNVSNTLCGAAVSRLIGIEREGIRRALKNMPAVSGRLEEVHNRSDDYRVFIDYAHTPDALKKLLMTLRECMSGNQRLICIFGCGGDRDRGKRSIMGDIAVKYADYCIITSDNPRSEDPYAIIKDIVKDIKKKTNYLIIENRQRAIEYAVHSAGNGDIIVLCGKGHEDYQIGVCGKKEFNEKKIIKEADEERIRIRGNEYNSCRQDENVSCGDSEDNRR